MTNLADRVAVISTTVGTGNFTLGAALASYRSFSAAFGNGPVYYGILDEATGDWEVGRGTLSGGGVTLARDVVYASSTGGAKVAFAAGNKTVYSPAPAIKISGMEDGTEGAPSWPFMSDTDTGFYSAGANKIGVAAGGVQVGELGTVALFPAGVAATPGIGFLGAATWGLSKYDADNMAMSVNGYPLFSLRNSAISGAPGAFFGGRGFADESTNQSLVTFGSLVAGTQPSLRFNTQGAGANIFVNRFNGGAIGTDNALAANDAMFSLQAGGATGSGTGTTVRGGIIRFMASGAFTPTAAPTDIIIYLGGPTSTALTSNPEVARFTGDKQLVMSSAGSSETVPPYTFEGLRSSGFFRVPSTVAMGWSIEGVERLRLSSGGYFSFSKDSNLGFGATDLGAFAIHGVSENNTINNFVAIRYADSAVTGAVVTAARARGTTQGARTIVQSGDRLGAFSFAGADGTVFNRAAELRGVVEGTPAAGDVRARISLCPGTSAANTTEVLTANTAGNVGIGTTAPTTKLHVTGAVRVGSYTKATLPDPVASGAGAIAWCSNATGGAALVTSNGTIWTIAGTQTAP